MYVTPSLWNQLLFLICSLFEVIFYWYFSKFLISSDFCQIAFNNNNNKSSSQELRLMEWLPSNSSLDLSSCWTTVWEREGSSASKPFLSQNHFYNAKAGHALTTQAEWPIQGLFQVFQTSSSLVTVGCLPLSSGFQGSKNPKAQWCLCFTCVLSLILLMSEPSIKGF